MQAFLVKVHSVSHAATITIPYSSVGTVARNTEMQHMKKLDAYKEDDKVLTIIDVCGTRYSDRMWLFTQKGCTHGYDNGWDGVKVLGSSLIPQVWAIENQDNYQINSFNDIDSTIIGFKKGEDSIYTLTVSHYNTQTQYPKLYMADLQTGSLTDVSANGTSLTFKSVSSSDNYARFMLLKPKGEMLDEYTPTKKTEMDIIAVNKNIYVVNNTDEDLIFKAINIDGKVLFQERISTKGLSKLNYKLSGGTYIGRLSSRSASVLRKFIIR